MEGEVRMPSPVEGNRSRLTSPFTRSVIKRGHYSAIALPAAGVLNIQERVLARICPRYILPANFDER